MKSKAQQAINTGVRTLEKYFNDLKLAASLILQKAREESAKLKNEIKTKLAEFRKQAADKNVSVEECIVKYEQVFDNLPSQLWDAIRTDLDASIYSIDNFIRSVAGDLKDKYITVQLLERDLKNCATDECRNSIEQKARLMAEIFPEEVAVIIKNAVIEMDKYQKKFEDIYLKNFNTFFKINLTIFEKIRVCVAFILN